MVLNPLHRPLEIGCSIGDLFIEMHIDKSKCHTIAKCKYGIVFKDAEAPLAANK